MTYIFRKAIRADVKVLVGLAGYTGAGKTVSMLRLGRGLAGNGRMVMLDTEAGRGRHHAHKYDFDYAEIVPPFSPQTYREAIEAAEKAGYDVIAIDSMSHEWAGDGGCCDMQAETLERMAKGDPYKLEKLTAPAWRDAKVAHKRMMSRLLQCRAHLIFGLRAEQKIRFVKVRGNDGKERTVIEDAGYQPICEKSFMFEMTCSFMLNDRHLPEPIKLPGEFEPYFPRDGMITEESGRRLAEWARGASTAGQGETPGTTVKSPAAAQAAPATNAEPDDLAAERDRLLGEVKRIADKLGLKAGARADAWRTYCGTGGPDNVDPAALTDLLKWLKARAGEA